MRICDPPLVSAGVERPDGVTLARSEGAGGGAEAEAEAGVGAGDGVTDLFRFISTE